MNNLELLKKELTERFEDLVTHAEQAPDDEILDYLYRIMRTTFAYPLLCSYCTYCAMDNCVTEGTPCKEGVKRWLKKE